MRKTYLLASLVYLSISTCVFAAGGVLPGAGTEASPYLIEDVNDFDAFADPANATGFRTITFAISRIGRKSTDPTDFFQSSFSI